MIPIVISTTIGDGGEYAQAVAAAGGRPRLPAFDTDAVETELDRCAGVLLSGGGDVDPRCYGGVSELAHDIEPARDAFELALVRRAKERGIPTLCICRGLQVANVAFGGTLIEDIATTYDPSVAARHRRVTDTKSERGLIAGHDVAIEPDSLLARIVGRTMIVTGSRHHQSILRPAADLRIVAQTPDRVIEAAEARFASPFWLGVQWHPESTVTLDDGVSRAIFAAFVDAAERFGAVR